MNTVFSHIVQRRLSHQSEDVATEALAFILNSSEPARRAFTDLLRRIKPDLPDLYFRTQRTAGDARPDMWGLDESNTPHVFIENKFWAGLTENQPVEYLRRLPATPEPSVLLFTVPAARQTTVWSELERRLDEAAIAATRRDSPPGAGPRANRHRDVAATPGRAGQPRTRLVPARRVTRSRCWTVRAYAIETYPRTRERNHETENGNETTKQKTGTKPRNGRAESRNERQPSPHAGIRTPGDELQVFGRFRPPPWCRS